MVTEMTLILMVIIAIGMISAFLEINLGGRKVWNYFFHENSRVKGLSMLVLVLIVILALILNLVSMPEETETILFYSAFSFGAALGIKAFRLGGGNPGK